jgi:hypothetical protein
MGLSSSAMKAGAGRGAVGSSDIRYAEHTMIVTTERRVRTVVRLNNGTRSLDVEEAFDYISSHDWSGG